MSDVEMSDVDSDGFPLPSPLDDATRAYVEEAERRHLEAVKQNKAEERDRGGRGVEGEQGKQLQGVKKG